MAGTDAGRASDGRAELWGLGENHVGSQADGATVRHFDVLVLWLQCALGEWATGEADSVQFNTVRRLVRWTVVWTLRVILLCHKSAPEVPTLGSEHSRLSTSKMTSSPISGATAPWKTCSPILRKGIGVSIP